MGGDPPLALNYKKHQKSLAYFSHLAPLFCSFLLKTKVKRREVPWQNAHFEYAPANRLRCALSLALF